MDSNHRSRKATDLQSVPFNHSGTYPHKFMENSLQLPFPWLREEDLNL